MTGNEKPRKATRTFWRAGLIIGLAVAVLALGILAARIGPGACAADEPQACGPPPPPPSPPPPPPPPVYFWTTSAWGACSDTCGSGTQIRAITCQDSSSNTVPNSNCTPPAPASSQACTDCSTCVYAWSASGFGACSNDCGTGTQTQTVTCTGGNPPACPATGCNLATQPPTSQSCTDMTGCPPPPSPPPPPPAPAPAPSPSPSPSPSPPPPPPCMGSGMNCGGATTAGNCMNTAACTGPTGCCSGYHLGSVPTGGGCFDGNPVMYEVCN